MEEIIRVAKVVPQHLFLRGLWNRRCVFPCLKCTSSCHSEACCSSSCRAEDSPSPQLLFISKVVDIPVVQQCGATQVTNGSQKTREVPQLQFIDQVVDIPGAVLLSTLVDMHVPQISKEITKVLMMVRQQVLLRGSWNRQCMLPSLPVFRGEVQLRRCQRNLRHISPVPLLTWT